MKKKSLLFFAVLITLSTFLVVPSQAQTYMPYTFLGLGTAGEAIVMLPGHPYIYVIEAIDFSYTTLGLPHDSLIISILLPDGTSIPWIAVTDKPQAAELLWKMFIGISPYFRVNLVGKNELEVNSMLRKITAVLNVPVEGVTPYGPMTIDPFTMKLEGSGLGEWTTASMPLPIGYTISASMMAYEATATITGGYTGGAVVYKNMRMVVK